MKLYPVHEIFHHSILRIPSYQRGYSWRNSEVITSIDDFGKVKGQLKDLWEDIKNIPTDKWHYIGLLTLVKKESNHSILQKHKQYEIVDGQQRITSIIILLSVIIEIAKSKKINLDEREGDEEYKYLYINKGGLNICIFGYEKDNPSDKFFKKYILQLDEAEDDSTHSSYTENLKNARAFFQVMVIDFIDDNSVKLQKLYDTITTKLKFNLYVLPDELDPFVVFETMNNRGKPLSELEKLKNRLMYLTSKLTYNKVELIENESEETLARNKEEEKLLTAQKEELEKTINKGWITIYSSLGKHKSTPLNDEEFLRNHWIIYFNEYDRSKSRAFSRFLFDEQFTLTSLYQQKIGFKEISNYVKSLQRASVMWNKINHPQFFLPEENKIKEVLLAVYRAGLRPSFKPLVLAILLRKDKDNFLNVIALLEEYSFKIFDVSDRQSNTGDSKLYRLAFQIYQNNRTVEDTLNDIKSYLNQYYHFPLFKNQVKELFEYGNRNGFYNWSGRFYFLFEYDNYLRSKNSNSTSANKISWEDFHNKKTIEHIYPQSAVQTLEEYCDKKVTEEKRLKYQKIQNDWMAFSELPKDQKRRFCNSLGNLLAMTVSDNSSAGNKSFTHKVDQTNTNEENKNRGYRYDSMSAQLVAKGYEEWTPETILHRGKKMLDYLWLKLHPQEPNTMTDDEHKELLGLGFLIKKKEEITHG